jgi:hypothetical protein
MVKLDKELGLISFEMLFLERISSEKITLLKQSIEAYFHIEKVINRNYDLTFDCIENYTKIQYKRDLETFTIYELEFLLSLLFELFGDTIYIDKQPRFPLYSELFEDEFVYQLFEETIHDKSNNKILGYRDGAKVYVKDVSKGRKNL